MVPILFFFTKKVIWQKVIIFQKLKFDLFWPLVTFYDFRDHLLKLQYLHMSCKYILGKNCVNCSNSFVVITKNLILLPIHNAAFLNWKKFKKGLLPKHTLMKSELSTDLKSVNELFLKIIFLWLWANFLKT